MILRSYLERANIVKRDDRRLAALIEDMERNFDIPRLNVHLQAWKTKTANADQILDVYRQISGMRFESRES
jgi:hypothetical protein